MNRPLRYTLLTDGSSDAALKHPVNWTLQQSNVGSFVAQWADLRLHRSMPKVLTERMKIAVDEYPCDLLLVHRDSEGDSLAERVREIEEELQRADLHVRAVCLVPVRKTEAWLLHDEAAIRMAAGNPTGKAPISLPHFLRVEDEPDPKAVLRRLLLDASEARGRRLKRKERDFPLMRLRVAELIEDWEPLRRLLAFQEFEASLKNALDAL